MRKIGIVAELYRRPLSDKVKQIGKYADIKVVHSEVVC